MYGLINKDEPIIYHGIKLKFDYLADIIGNMIIKYKFQDTVDVMLSSIVMKKRYGKYYNYYIQYLTDNGLIFMSSNYYNGEKARSYSLNSGIVSQDVILHKITDNFLIKKTIETPTESDLNDKNPILPYIKEKLISDLDYVTIDEGMSLDFLNNLKTNEQSYLKNLYTINNILSNNIYWKFDNYGRFHTNFTTLKSEIRKNCLYINGNKTCEFDIPNSQPLFLSKLLLDYKHKIDSDEYIKYTDAVVNHRFYEDFIKEFKDKYNEDITRDEVKKIICCVFFGKNNEFNKADDIFSRFYPTIYRFIRNFKRSHKNHAVLAHVLQKMESDLIFNKIIKEIMETNSNIKVFTVHDSINVELKYKDIVKDIFDRNFNKEFISINNI